MLRAAVTSPSQCRGSHVRQHSHDIVEEGSRDRTPSRTMVCNTVCMHRHSIDRSSATRGSSSRRRSPQRGVVPPHEPSGAASRRRATATANARKGAIACCERACAPRAAGVTRNRRRRFESFRCCDADAARAQRRRRCIHITVDRSPAARRAQRQGARLSTRHCEHHQLSSAAACGREAWLALHSLRSGRQRRS